jgi:hypothetical protein
MGGEQAVIGGTPNSDRPARSGEELPALVELYRVLRDELVASGLLLAESPLPSNHRHKDVTMTITRCSWIEGRWVLDEPMAAAV